METMVDGVVVLLLSSASLSSSRLVTDVCCVAISVKHSRATIRAYVGVALYKEGAKGFYM
jgi:hypothetical protein